MLESPFLKKKLDEDDDQGNVDFAGQERLLGSPLQGTSPDAFNAGANANVVTTPIYNPNQQQKKDSSEEFDEDAYIDNNPLLPPKPLADLFAKPTADASTTDASLDDVDIGNTEENKQKVQKLESTAVDHEGVPVITATKTIKKTPHKKIQQAVSYDERSEVSDFQQAVPYDKRLEISDMKGLVEALKLKNENNPSLLAVIKAGARNLNETNAKRLVEQLKKFEVIAWPDPYDVDKYQPYANIGPYNKKYKPEIYIDGKSHYFTDIKTGKPSIDPYVAFEQLGKPTFQQDGDKITLTWEKKTAVTVDVKEFGENLMANGIKINAVEAEKQQSPEAEKSTKRRKTSTKTADADAPVDAPVEKKPIVSATEEEKPLDYAQQRLANIARNDAFLASLGIEPINMQSNSSVVNPKKPTVVKPKKPKDPDFVPNKVDSEDEGDEERVRRQPRKVAQTSSSTQSTTTVIPKVIDAKVIDANTRQLIDEFLNLGKQPTLSFYNLARAIRPITQPSGAPIVSSALLAAQTQPAEIQTATKKPSQKSKTTIEASVKQNRPNVQTSSTAQTTRQPDSSATQTTRSATETSIFPGGMSKKTADCLGLGENSIFNTAIGLEIDLLNDDLTPKSARQLCTEIVAKQNVNSRKATSRDFDWL